MKLHEWQAKMKDEKTPAGATVPSLGRIAADNAIDIFEYRHQLMHGQPSENCDACETEEAERVYATEPFLKDDSGKTPDVAG